MVDKIRDELDGEWSAVAAALPGDFLGNMVHVAKLLTRERERVDRVAQAKAIRWVAGDLSSWGNRYHQLKQLADAVESGEVKVP